MIKISPLMFLENKFIQNINNILGKNKINKLGVAVSGGGDSVALLCLVKKWVEINNKLKVTVFIIDHNLRNESKVEIAYVKKLAIKFNFNFVLLSWEIGHKTSAIQERARQARYTLINEKCKILSIPLLLTAHHFDDMLETYFIKKSKKVSDLALLPNITYFWDDLWIIRPLFNVKKQELIDYLTKKNISWFEDESNQSDKYERNRVRKILLALSKIEKKKLILNYSLSIKKAKILNQILIKSFAEVLSISNYGFAKIDIGKFSKLEKEIKIHIINYVLTIISGKLSPPRSRKVVNIIINFLSKKTASSTLNHCKLHIKENELIIYKERVFINNNIKVNSNYRPHLETTFNCYIEEGLSHHVCYWDNRFEVTLNKENYSISSLKMEDYIVLVKYFNLTNLAQESNNNHIPILFTLPVVKKLEKVVAIPHISYYDYRVLNDTIKVTFKPKFISRFTHFF